jgi:hypothetical protein
MKRAQIDVYEKLLLTLPITGAQAELLCDKTQELQARLQVEAAKAALRQGQYQEALKAAREANGVLKSAKLSMAVAGLRLFPNLLRFAYRAYERVQQRRQNRRAVRYRADANTGETKIGHKAFSRFEES